MVRENYTMTKALCVLSKYLSDISSKTIMDTACNGCNKATKTYKIFSTIPEVPIPHVR